MKPAECGMVKPEEGSLARLGRSLRDLLDIVSGPEKQGVTFIAMASVKCGPAPSPQLSFHEPMECLLVPNLPEGPEWTYEIKLDGYRAQALCNGSQTRLLSRNGKDLGQRFPALIPELAKAFPPDSIVDGELVALDPSGRPSFSLIQNSATSRATFVFFAFDLLRLEGAELTQRPLSERRALLRASLCSTVTVQLSEGFNIPAKQMLELVRSHGLEGVVAKRLSSTYEQGRRSGAWSSCVSSFLKSLSSAATRQELTASMLSWLASTKATVSTFAPAFAPGSFRQAAEPFMPSSHLSKTVFVPSSICRKPAQDDGDRG